MASGCLTKGESYVHTGNQTEDRRPSEVGTINKATNEEQSAMGKGQLKMVN